MDVALVSSMISGLVAIVAVVIPAFNQNRINKINQMQESSKKHKFYLEPLIKSSADLQSRIYNITEGGFLGGYYHGGNQRQRDYVILHTTYLFSQFFAWSEATRQDVQFLNLENDERTRRLSELQDVIYSLIQTDRLGKYFVIFSGEQRAIGERMLVKSVNGYGCIGYGEFIKMDLVNHEPFLNQLKQEVVHMADDFIHYQSKFIKLQHTLIDLIDYLDPKYIRVTENKRRKILL